MTQGELIASLEGEGWDVVTDDVEYTEDGYERHKITALKISGNIINRNFFFYYITGGSAYWLGTDPTVGPEDNVTPYLSGWVAGNSTNVAYVLENFNPPDTAVALLYEEAGVNATEKRAIVYRNSSSVMTHKPIA